MNDIKLIKTLIIFSGHGTHPAPLPHLHHFGRRHVRLRKYNPGCVRLASGDADERSDDARCSGKMARTASATDHQPERIAWSCLQVA